ncbi:helix-turn-helix domain-containing protein [Mycobacterium sp. SMC-4]|uniref:helix-turn-helix domain-containing protein n=1 Tax=Mycobacterium sp. SMC-4 TaxID=2857059 RepID=UPI003D05DBDF
MTTSLRMIDGGAEQYVSAPRPAADGDGYRRAVEADLLRRIGAIAATAAQRDLQEMLDDLAIAVIETSTWAMCGIETFDPVERTLLDWTHAGFAPSAGEVFDQWVNEGDPSLTSATRDRILVIPDVSKADEFPTTRREAIRTGFRSAVYVPVRLTDRWSVLTLCHSSTHEFTREEVALAESVAAAIAVAVESVLRARGWQAGTVRPAAESRARFHDRLLRLQIADATLDEFCCGISELLASPVLLVDRFEQPLASAKFTPEHVAELLGTLSGHRSAVRSGDNVIQLKAGREDLLVGHAYDGANRVGSLIVGTAPVTDTDSALSELLTLACDHVALALLRKRASIETDIRMRQDFGEALGGMDPSSAALTQSGAVLGIDLAARHRVMRVHPEGLRCPLSAHDAFEVAEQLSKRLAQNGFGAVVAPVGGVDFVVVLHDEQSRRGAATPAEVVRAGLRDLLSALLGPAAGSVAIGIGIGNAALGVQGLDRSHREARQALEVARTIDGDDADRHIADVGSYAVLAGSSTATADDQDLFARRYLEPLMEYDRIHSAGYVETLQTYFENVGNVQRTADKLFLHLSTVRYRLKRIEEIAGIDLRDEEDRLCMQLALRIARFTEQKRCAN